MQKPHPALPFIWTSRPETCRSYEPAPLPPPHASPAAFCQGATGMRFPMQGGKLHVLSLPAHMQGKGFLS